VVVEFTQPRPTKASVGTRTNMLRARECLRSRVASLCQPVHECVSQHTDLSTSLASGGRIEWQHGVPDQRVLQQRSHVYAPAYHDTWRPSSARAYLLKDVCLVLPCCCLLAPLSPGSSVFFLNTQRVAHHRRRLYDHEYHR